MGCTRITSECPVGDTTYGYYPSLSANAVLVDLFTICALAQIALGVKYHLMLYSILMFLGCIGEAVGYIGRIMLHSNPWNNAGFIMQVLLLIVSPSFLAAALYLALKQFVLYYGPQYSKPRPNVYTRLFISCDEGGFLTQLVGGGISASASSSDEKTLKLGNDIMIAGIAFQAGTMAVAGILAIDFAQRVIPEMAGGWGNGMLKNEVEFMILDGAMIATGAILTTVAYPGAFTSPVNTHTTEQRKADSREKELDLEDMRLRP